MTSVPHSRQPTCHILHITCQYSSVKSDEVIGNDMISSVSSGVLSGMLFEIEGYILRNPEKIAVFTGGDAIYFAKRMKNSIFVVCNLVLMGLALIAVEYDKKD